MNYEIYLDDKNKEVLDKYKNNKTMTTREKKRLYRTKQVIKNIDKKREFNKKYEDVLDSLFA